MPDVPPPTPAAGRAVADEDVRERAIASVREAFHRALVMRDSDGPCSAWNAPSVHEAFCDICDTLYHVPELLAALPARGAPDLLAAVRVMQAEAECSPDGRYVVPAPIFAKVLRRAGVEADCAMQATPAWQDATTAPRTGEHILVTRLGEKGFGGWPRERQDWCAVVHFWENPGEGGFYLSSGASSEFDDRPVSFTHWMPLPGGCHDHA